MTRRNRKLCVAIARDVLEQLRLKRYAAKQDTYVQVFSEEGMLCSQRYDDEGDKSFKDFFAEKQRTTCKVCALGAAFVSLVNLKNDCSVNEMVADIDRDRLEDIFGNDNLNLMESAFEKCEMGNSMMIDEDEHSLEAAGDWGNQYAYSNERLRAIMLNVIRNNGDFKLPKKYAIMAKRLRREDNEYAF